MSRIGGAVDRKGPLQPHPKRVRVLRILVADDQPADRQALRILLEREGFEVVAEAADGRQAVRLAQQLHPDVAVLDLGMPVVNGADAAREIHRRMPETRIVLLWMYDEDPSVLKALRASVPACDILKARAPAELVGTIRQAATGAVRRPERRWTQRRRLPDRRNNHMRQGNGRRSGLGRRFGDEQDTRAKF